MSKGVPRAFARASPLAVAGAAGATAALLVALAPTRLARAANPPGTPASTRAVTQLRAGHEAFRAGDYRAAAAALAGLADTRGALGSHALYLLAESEQQAREPRQAAAHFDELARRGAGLLSQVAPWRAADARWVAGDRADAAAAYRALLAPGSARKPGKADKAAPTGGARAALPVDPVPARLRLAEHLIASGRTDEARRWLDEIVVQAPEHPLAAEAAKLRTGRPGPVPTGLAPTGQAPTGQAPSVSPGERLRRAEVQAAARDYAAAATELESIPSEAPDAIRVERDLALGMVLYRMRSDYARASRLLQGVVDRLSGERAASAAFHGARALSRAHRDDDAIAGYRALIARFPHTRFAAEAQFLCGWLEVNRGRFRAGLADLHATVERYGRSEFAEDAAWFLALCHLLLDAPKDALAALDRFVTIARRGKGAHEAELRADYFRARALARLGRNDEATLRLTTLARRAPFHYYGLLAAARLREASAPVPFDLPTLPKEQATRNPRALPPSPSIVAGDPALAEADALLAAGLDVEAGQWLARAEPALRRRLGARALHALLPRYARMAAHHRAYQIAELEHAAKLREPPIGEARAIWEAAYPRAYAAEISARAGDVPPLFLWSIMRKESGFDPLVISYADARGLLQMLPETTADLAAKEATAFFPDELFVPATNIRWGATFIGSIWRSFGGDPLVTAGGYNGGPKAMSRWCAQSGQRPTDEFVELVTFEQSREYIKRVAGIYARYHYLYTGRPFALAIGPGCRQAPPAAEEPRGPATLSGMAKIRGTLKKSDLEGGHMQLLAEDGTTYEIEGQDPLLSRDGARVEIEGSVDRAAFSLAMTGPRLKVKSVRALP